MLMLILSHLLPRWEGQVSEIREALDKASFTNTGIMSYSTKFAPNLYSPFREAVGSYLIGIVKVTKSTK